ncbi:MAG: hypothetical protein A2Y10_07305 [Planctomycetes bacterium GWF2_41_51]|nr:MAG: hypothetical protein A2Y10_07305 [Planctomycetes bacterium GWF2_41_51]HBG28927.1 hypothetical protein [Phycisphaerales bacterium]
MCPSNDRSVRKSILDKFIGIMTDLNVIERRRNRDRRVSSAGYNGPERRSGVDRRDIDID